MKILLVTGFFDEKQGKLSKLGYVIANHLIDLGATITHINGGTISHLQEIIGDLDYTAVIWMANMSNEHEKILPSLKKIRSNFIQISSKRITEKGYALSDVVGHLLKNHSNLGIAIETIDESSHKYNFTLLDPLGNVFIDKQSSDSLQKFCFKLYERIYFLSELQRINGYRISPQDEPIVIEEDFLSIIRDYGKEFSKHVNAVNPNRFLGNASTRCSYGFPAVKDGDNIYVSRRNIDKKCIDSSGFVKVKSDIGEKYQYYGNHKPSVDTPLQLLLYKYLPNIKYMIHGHVYIEGAPTTQSVLPCGATAEVHEIINSISESVCNTQIEKFSINLRGHGCLVASNDLKYFKDIKFISRPFPELQY